jgi:hypothetical protein
LQPSPECLTSCHSFWGASSLFSSSSGEDLFDGSRRLGLIFGLAFSPFKGRLCCNQGREEVLTKENKGYKPTSLGVKEKTAFLIPSPRFQAWVISEFLILNS